jgi:hypothetical protein
MPSISSPKFQWSQSIDSVHVILPHAVRALILFYSSYQDLYRLRRANRVFLATKGLM